MSKYDFFQEIEIEKQVRKMINKYVLNYIETKINY